MNSDVREIDQLADAAQLLPPHLREKFERIDHEIQTAYGYAPGVMRLARLWLACGSAQQIRRQFELAVLDSPQGRSIEPNANGEFDEDCL